MQQLPTVGQRLLSMLLDHVVMCCILGIVMTPFVLSSFDSDTPERGVFFETKDWIGMIGMITVYALKDSFGGRSVGKRVLKLQVIDRNSGNTASPVQCFVRNLLVPLWMIEVVVTFFNPQRRIGDRLAGTRVVAVPA
ncbi:RDD family protein [Flaviaesturariibacter amylovorans]|uniref:RDD domain-containing protein n=1 Tax=Flaviaesturariibacter amylovorans TaxID=1084520 RepID=A0ABP8GK12_9BACT